MDISLAPLALAPAPLGLALAALAPGSADQRIARTWRAALLALASSALAVGLYAYSGAASTPLVGTALFGFSLRLDALSATMTALVSLLGAVVLRFSARYLADDPRQGAFLRWMALTLAAVLALVSAGHLAQLMLAWVATSAALHQLLVFHPERPKARMVAQKKFIISRAGDICLAAALIFLGAHYGTLEITSLAQAAEASRALGVVPPALVAAGLCLACAALLKSAQFPFHGWLTQVMETPTTVSALLHAGVINAGGFLLLRTMEIVSLSQPGMHLLAVVGGLTTLYASLVMRAQSSVKVGLAWSTVAQMGFMLLQCGLGLFSAALVHIVAHSLYKAHAFLSAASTVEQRLDAIAPAPPSLARLALVCAATLGVAATVANALGHAPLAHPGESLLVAVLCLGLAQLGTSALPKALTPQSVGTLLRVVVVCVALGALYGGVQFVGAQVFSVVPPHPTSTLEAALVFFLLVGFVIVALAQATWPGRLGEAWDNAYVHFANGLYVDAWMTRLLLADGTHRGSRSAPLPLSTSEQKVSS